MARPSRAFAFRLAGHLGMTVRQLLDSIDSAEFAEWMAYDQLDPFGGERGDLQAAIIAAATVSPHMKKGRRVRPQQFMPKFRRPRPSPEEMRRQFQAAVELSGLRKPNGNHR